MTIKTAPIGVISEGTLRNEDLIPAFTAALVEYNHPDAAQHQHDAEHCGVEGLTDADATEWIGELADALQECAPPYCYFGTAEGDGACFGFWPESVQHMQDAGVEIVSDLADIEPREVAVINDHGNITFGTLDGNGFKPIWSIV